MNEFFPMVLAFLIIAAVAIPLSIMAAMMAQERREALASGWAAARGYNYLRSNPAMLPLLRDEPHSADRSAKVEEFIDGTISGHPFCSFKYSYEVSTGTHGNAFGGPHFGSFMDSNNIFPSSSSTFGGPFGTHNIHGFTTGNTGSTTTVNRSIIMMRLPAALPGFSLTHEGIGDKIQKFFGGQDIELESDDFNQLFRVQSPVEGFAYGVLHPRMMEWLMGPASSLVPFVIDGPDVIFRRDGEPDYTALDGQLAVLSEFIDQIPQGVFEQYGAPPALGWRAHR